MNKELLLKVASYIKAHPEEFDMDGWDCGTTACIAGHVLRLSGADPSPNYPVAASRALQITEEEASELFFQIDWPSSFSNRLDDAFLGESTQDYADIAVERIEAFIKEYEQRTT